MYGGPWNDSNRAAPQLSALICASIIGVGHTANVMVTQAKTGTEAQRTVMLKRCPTLRTCPGLPVDRLKASLPRNPAFGV